MKTGRLLALAAAIVSALSSLAPAQVPVGTEFTYQGVLKASGAPVSGSVDMRFRLYDAAAGGNRIGPELQLLNGSVDDGKFTVILDFGASSFGPFARWLEVAVRTPAGSFGPFTTLDPRQRISVTPVAAFALSGNQGPTGPVGPTGPSGASGPTGATGTPGAVGATGPQGLQGYPGYPGPAGPSGPSGPSGPIGPQGTAGLVWKGVWSPAVTYAIDDAVFESGSSYRCLAAPNTGNSPSTSPAFWQLVAKQGDAGATGATGVAGGTGPAGPTGAQGVAGQQGPPGVPGAVGATGPIGPTGPVGAQGAQGIPGPTGPIGATGAPGSNATVTPFVVGHDSTDPFSSVQAAVSAAEATGAPSLVLVKPGVYSGSVVISRPDITLRGSGEGVTVLTGTLHISSSLPPQASQRCILESFSLRVSVENAVTVDGAGPVSVSFSHFTVDATGPIITSVRIAPTGGGRVSMQDCRVAGLTRLEGSLLSFDGVDDDCDGFTVFGSFLHMHSSRITSSSSRCVDVSGGGRVTMDECRLTAVQGPPGSPSFECVSVSGSSSSFTGRACTTFGILLSSGGSLDTSDCELSSVENPCLVVTGGGTCVCTSSRMSSSYGGGSGGSVLRVDSSSSMTCRSCITSGQLQCDASTLYLEGCDNDCDDADLCVVTNGGQCTASSCRLTGGGGGGGGGRIAVRVSSTGAWSGSNCEVSGRCICDAASLRLQSCTVVDLDDDGLVDVINGGSCVAVSTLIDSGRGPTDHIASRCVGQGSTCDFTCCTVYGGTQTSNGARRTVLESYFETGDIPTAEQFNSRCDFRGCTFVRSHGAPTNADCFTVSGSSSTSTLDDCRFNGKYLVSGATHVIASSCTFVTLDQPCLSVTGGSTMQCSSSHLQCGDGSPSDARCLTVSGQSSVSLFTCRLDGGEECDDSNLSNEACSVRCVSSSPVVCSSTSHFLIQNSSLESSASPAVSAAQGADVRYGVVTYTGSGGGMPPQALALPVENVAQLATIQVQHFSGPVQMTSPSNVFGGNGAALTSLDASHISSGILADSHLPSSVVRTTAPNTFTLENTFVSTLHAQGGVQFADGSLQATAARPPLSQFTVGKDPGDAFTSIQSAVDAAQAAGGARVVFVKPGTYQGDVTISSPDITLRGASGGPDQSSTMLGQLRLAVPPSSLTPGSVYVFSLTVRCSTGPAVVVDGQGPVDVTMSDMTCVTTSGSPCVVLSPTAGAVGGGGGRIAMTSCRVSGGSLLASGSSLTCRVTDTDCDDGCAIVDAAMTLSSSRLHCPSGVCLSVSGSGRCTAESCRWIVDAQPPTVSTIAVSVTQGASLSCTGCSGNGQMVCTGGRLSLSSCNWLDTDDDNDGILSIRSGGTCTVTSSRLDAGGGSQTNRAAVHCTGVSSVCDMTSVTCNGGMVCDGNGLCIARVCQMSTLDGTCITVSQGSFRAFDCAFTTASPTALCLSATTARECLCSSSSFVGGLSLSSSPFTFRGMTIRSSQPTIIDNSKGLMVDCRFSTPTGVAVDSSLLSCTGPQCEVSMFQCALDGAETCDDGASISSDGCSISCVSAPCATVSSSSHWIMSNGILRTAASPAVASVQGGDVRFGVVTYTGTGSGMPPFAVALQLQNLPMLSSSSLQTFSGPVSMTNPSNTFAGDGSGLTGLDASHITTGTLSDALLPSSIVRTSSPNTFTQSNTFTQPLHVDGGVTFSDGSVQTTAAAPPLSSFVVGKDPGDAFSSIQAAVTACQAAGGGTIFVKSGLYNEPIFITKSNIVITGASSRDGRSYVSGHFALELDGTTSGRVVIQGLDVASPSGPAIVMSGQHFSDVLISDCALSCPSGTCVSVDLPGVDSTGRRSPFHLSRCTVLSSAGQAPVVSILSGDGRLDLCRVTAPPEGVSLSCVSGAATKQYVDSCDFTGRVAFAQSGLCNVSRCTITLPPSPLSNQVALSVGSTCQMTCSDGYISGGRIDCTGSSSLYMTGGSITVPSGEDSVRLSVQARDQFDNVRMSGRIVCDGQSSLTCNGGSLTVSSGDCITTSIEPRITLKSFRMSGGRLYLFGGGQCDMTDCSVSNPGGVAVVYHDYPRSTSTRCSFDGMVQSTGTSDLTFESCRLSVASGDCLQCSGDGTMRYRGVDFQGRVALSGSTGFTFQSCVFDNGQLSCLDIDDDCDGISSDCTFKSSVVSKGTKQKAWLCSNFRFSSGTCFTVDEDCDDTCDDCTFDGHVLLTGSSRSTFTSCRLTSTGQCLTVSGNHRDGWNVCHVDGHVSFTGSSSSRLQGCTFTSTGTCLSMDQDCDSDCDDCTFYGLVQCGGDSTFSFADDRMLLGLRVYGSSQGECFSDVIDSALNLQDDGVVRCSCTHLRSSSGSCVTMSGASSLTLVQSQLDSPPGSLAITAAPTASLSVAQLTFTSALSALPPQTTQVSVADPVDSSRIVDGSVSTLDLAPLSVDSSRLAIDSSSLLHVSGGTLDASSSAGGRSITLLGNSVLMFGGQDVSLYRSSSLLHLDGSLESSSSIQVLGGDLVVHSGLVTATGGAVLGGGGGGGGSGGSVRVSAVGDLDMDGSLDVATSLLHLDATGRNVGVNEVLPDTTFHVLASSGDRAASFSSSSSSLSGLLSEVTIPAAQVAAMEGLSHSPLLQGAGVHGRNDSPVGQGVGVLGETHSPQGFGLFSIGNSGASGLKSFHIDHPLDPANKFLRHYSAEGPEALNIYRGTVILNQVGEAVVSLPDYFEAINKDFDYQLTCVGGFAPVYIADEVHNNTFKIAGGRAGLKICWVVTGVRNDAFARAAAAPVEVQKPAELRGKYLHPELLGQPADKAIFRQQKEEAPAGVAAKESGR